MGPEGQQGGQAEACYGRTDGSQDRWEPVVVGTVRPAEQSRRDEEGDGGGAQGAAPRGLLIGCGE